MTGIQVINTLKIGDSTNNTTLTSSATGEKAVSFPDYAGIVALLERAQTFTTVQTFSAGIAFNSGGTSGNGKITYQSGSFYFGNNAGIMTDAGQWQLGVSGGANELVQTHSFYFGKSSRIYFKKSDATVGYNVQAFTNNSNSEKLEIGIELADGAYIAGSSSGDAFMSTNTAAMWFSANRGTPIGKFSSDGQWNLGPTNKQIQHSFKDSAGDTAHVLALGFKATQTTLATTERTDIVCNANIGGWFVLVENASTGESGLFFLSYASATITEISDVSSIFEITDTGSTFAIYKSANSYGFSVKNKYGTSKTIQIIVIGNSISSISNPA